VNRWKFKTLGLAVLPIVFATPFVWLFSGYLADKIANKVAKRTGRREPEAHLLTLIVPLFLGILGAILFGYAGSHILTVHWSMLLFGIFFVALSFLSANTIISVYVVESYPQWAGPVLVNISSFRCIIGFALSFRATTWVAQMGFMASFAIYAGVLAVLSCFLPFLYVYGKPLRKWTAGTVKKQEDRRRTLYAPY
jgi:MFS family permease